MFEDYLHYDGLGLAELIAKREVTAKEVLEAAIRRAEKRNPELNAIVQLDREGAIAAQFLLGQRHQVNITKVDLPTAD